MDIRSCHGPVIISGRLPRRDSEPGPAEVGGYQGGVAWPISGMIGLDVHRPPAVPGHPVRVVRSISTAVAPIGELSTVAVTTYREVPACSTADPGGAGPTARTANVATATAADVRRWRRPDGRRTRRRGASGGVYRLWAG